MRDTEDFYYEKLEVEHAEEAEIIKEAFIKEFNREGSDEELREFGELY